MWAFLIMTALLVMVPVSGIYPFFVMQALCFALFACAFNLLIGYSGLLSFGHAMFSVPGAMSLHMRQRSGASAPRSASFSALQPQLRLALSPA